MREIVLHKGEHKHLLIWHPGEECADWHILQEEDSVLTIHVFCLDTDREAEHTLHFAVEQNGPHAETYIYGMGVLVGAQSVRVHTHVQHNSTYGKSEQLLKFAVRDEAQGEFFGELIVAPHAQHTDARQTNRNILLSRQAVMRTQPQLEIYADDVKCAHGATTGQLDESALFYMQQRGLDADTARQLLLTAFFHDVTRTLNNDTLEQRLTDRIADSLC